MAGDVDPRKNPIWTVIMDILTNISTRKESTWSPELTKVLMRLTFVSKYAARKFKSLDITQAMADEIRAERPYVSEGWFDFNGRMVRYSRETFKVWCD